MLRAVLQSASAWFTLSTVYITKTANRTCLRKSASDSYVVSNCETEETRTPDPHTARYDAYALNRRAAEAAALRELTTELLKASDSEHVSLPRAGGVIPGYRGR